MIHDKDASTSEPWAQVGKLLLGGSKLSDYMMVSHKFGVLAHSIIAKHKDFKGSCHLRNLLMAICSASKCI